MLADLPGPADVPAPSAAPAYVVAIVVTHDATRWLDQALPAVARQTRRPDAVVVVDTGSLDASPRLAAELVPTATIVELGRRVGYGAAVAAGVAAAPVPDDRVGWLWLLHDDCAPEADALQCLLAAGGPDVAVVGAKLVDWFEPRALLEVGVTTDGAGRRITGLEAGEMDQGQHDGGRDVLAVSSAGMLARADVWGALGGFDPTLPLWRDDLDYGWRVRSAGYRVVVEPAARIRHVQAATNGMRRLHAVRGRAPAVDRRHALYTVAANTTTPLAWQLLRLVLAAVLRAVLLAVTRRPAAASRELGAAGWILRRTGTLARARRARRRRRVPTSELKPLFPPRTAGVRAAVDVVGTWATRGPVDESAPGLLDPEVEDDDLPPGSRLPAFLTEPGVLLALALVAVTAVAVRSLMGGDGVLWGGRLLPAPGGASDLWATVTDSWHRYGAGTDAPAPGYLAVLAAAATVLLGKASLAVELLVVASVPLAGLLAFRAARHVVASPALRAWAGATYALLPVATGAVATARLDALVVLLALPPLLAAGARLWRSATWRAGLRTGLLLVVVGAFSPLTVVVLLFAAAVVAAVVARPTRTGALALATTFAVAVVLLLPQWLALAGDPGRLLHGPGRLVADGDLVDRRLGGEALLALWPGGAGLPPRWAAVALLAAALAGLVRRTRRKVAVAGWLVAGVGYAFALLLARIEAHPAGGPDVVAWPGVPLLVAAAGLLVAALAAADGIRERLAQQSFGWQQVLAGLTAALAMLTPVLLAGLWLARGAEDPVRRAPVGVLPAFAAADLARSPGARVLTLRAEDGLGYDLTTGTGARLGAADQPMSREQRRRLDAVVSDLVVPRGSDAGAALGTYGVRYVVATGPQAAELATALDTQSGLARVPFSGVRLWELPDASTRMSLLSPELAAAASTARAPQLGVPDVPRPLPDRELPDGPAGRVLVLAEAADDDWTATLDGRELPARRAWGWAQAFTLPAGGGTLEVEHRSWRPPATLALQGVAVLALLVTGRRPDVDDDEEQP